MKAKHSFLAPAFCLGLVITLVIAACSSDNPSNPALPPDPNGPDGNTNYSSEANGEVIGICETCFTISVDELSSKVTIRASATATQEEPVVVEELSINGGDRSWIKNITYNGQPNLTPSKTVVLEAEIDLKEPAIECGKKYDIQFKACQDEACSQPKRATKNSEFTKPSTIYACQAANSSGGPGASSSSEAVWVFAAPQTADVILGLDIPIGSGSFKLTGDNDTQPDLVVSGGTIRRATGIGDDDVEPGKSYSSKYEVFGSEVPSGSTEVAQEYQYYIIYFSDSKYLLLFSRIGDKWYNWPKKCTYWKATESP